MMINKNLLECFNTPAEINESAVKKLDKEIRVTLFDCQQIGEDIAVRMELPMDKWAIKTRHEFCEDVYYACVREVTYQNELSYKFVGVAVRGNLASWYANALSTYKNAPHEWQSETERSIINLFKSKYPQRKDEISESLDNSNNDVQYGVHSYSQQDIIFRGTEEECADFIEKHSLWDDAEVYRIEKDDKYYIKEDRGNFKKSVPEYLWSDVCSNRLDKVKAYFERPNAQVNRRYNRFNMEHSLIMGALRNGNLEMVDLLKSFGETILDNEQNEFDKLNLYYEENPQYVRQSTKKKVTTDTIEESVDSKLIDKAVELYINKINPYGFNNSPFDNEEDYIKEIKSTMSDKKYAQELINEYKNEEDEYSKEFISILKQLHGLNENLSLDEGIFKSKLVFNVFVSTYTDNKDSAYALVNQLNNYYADYYKTKVENIDRYSYSHAKIEIDVTDKIANFKRQENLEYWVNKLNEKLKSAMAGYNYRYRDDGMRSVKVSIQIGLDASLFKRGEGDKWNKRELFVGELYSNSITTNEKNIKVDVDRENFGMFSNAIRTMFGSPKKESLQLKESKEDKMYVGIWDDTQDDFITYREFNSFGDALEFASKYDYSNINSGVVKFDTNSLFTKGFASEFDIVDGKTDLKAMQELMPKKDKKENFLSEAISPKDISDYCDTSEQETTLKFINRIAKQSGVNLRIGTKVGKYPQSLIIDNKYQDNAIRISPNGACQINGESFGSYKDEPFVLDAYESEIMAAIKEMSPVKENKSLVCNLILLKSDIEEINSLLGSTARMQNWDTDQVVCDEECVFEDGTKGRLLVEIGEDENETIRGVFELSTGAKEYFSDEIDKMHTIKFNKEGKSYSISVEGGLSSDYYTNKRERENSKKLFGKKDITESTVLEGKNKVSMPYDKLTYEQQQLADYVFDNYWKQTRSGYGTGYGYIYVDLPEDKKELLDEIKEYYDDRVTLRDINKIYNAFDVDDVQLYDGQIQLSDRHVLFSIDVHEDDYELYYYDDAVVSYLENFDKTYGVETSTLGRSGRHICIECNAQNFINSAELISAYKNLEDEFIEHMNYFYQHYGDEDEKVDESLNDYEDDWEESNLYGGDLTYCPICNHKLVRDEDGDSYCPTCKEDSYSLSMKRRKKNNKKDSITEGQ